MADRALLLDTEFTAKLVKVKVKDGKGIVKDGKAEKEFILDRARPFLLKSRLGTKRLYILKWDSLEPLNFDVRTKTIEYVNPETNEKIQIKRKELVPINPEEVKFKREKVIPEVLRQTADLRFLKHMKKYAEGKPPIEIGFIPIILSLIFGAILMYILISLKVIPV